MRVISSSGWQLFSVEKSTDKPRQQTDRKVKLEKRVQHLANEEMCFSSDVTGHTHNSLYCYNDVAQCVVLIGSHWPYTLIKVIMCQC